MPGFAGILQPQQRWDAINFLLARGAGIQTRGIGPELASGATAPVPNFAFEAGGAQTTLRRLLEQGPVLLVLYVPPAPVTRLRELATAQPRLAAAGLNLVAVRLAGGGGEDAAPLAVGVSREVGAALALFQAPGERETELLLDRGGNVRLRWTSGGSAGLAPPGRLAAAAKRVARIPIAAPSHAGHAH